MQNLNIHHKDFITRMKVSCPHWKLAAEQRMLMLCNTSGVHDVSQHEEEAIQHQSSDDEYEVDEEQRALLTKYQEEERRALLTQYQCPLTSAEKSEKCDPPRKWVLAPLPLGSSELCPVSLWARVKLPFRA